MVTLFLIYDGFTKHFTQISYIFYKTFYPGRFALQGVLWKHLTSALPEIISDEYVIWVDEKLEGVSGWYKLCLALLVMSMELID